MIDSLRRLWAGRTPSGRATPRRRACLGVETLEGRALPSFTLSPVNVSGNAAGDQFESAVAAQGSRNVAAWTDRVSATDTDVKARVYSTDGPTVRTVTVAGSPYVAEGDPAVAVDGQGNFVVVWHEDGSIKGARYTAAGDRLGSTFTVAPRFTRVNYGTAAFPIYVSYETPHAEPAVAADAAGNFVVTYRDESYSVRAAMYAAGGARGATIYVGYGRDAAVARNAEGRFAVAYEKFVDCDFLFGCDDLIELVSYSAAGVRTGAYQITQASDEGSVARPSVAIADAGDCVVAYERWVYRDGEYDPDVLARTVSSAGVMSATLPISTTRLSETGPAVAMDRSDGDFVVAFEGNLGIYGGRRVFVYEYNASGALKASFDAGAAGLTQPAVAMSERDEYYLTFTGVDMASAFTGTVDPGQGIFYRQGRLA